MGEKIEKIDRGNYKFELHGNILDQVNHIEKVIESNRKRVLSFFGRKDMDSCYIHVFEDMAEIKRYLNDNCIMSYEEQPDYLCGVERLKKIFYLSYEDPYFKNNDYTQEDYDKVIVHEFIHLVEDKIFPRHPEWLSEGIACYLSGQYKNGPEYVMDNYVKNYKMPDIKDLKGETFKTDNYDGYDLSYLMVCYLIEILGKKEFVEMLKDRSQIEYIETKVLQETLEFYKERQSEMIK